jgi:DNA replication and repair protein RecF
MLLKEEKNCYPLLLLDDIFDKLDFRRINKIFELLNSALFGQVFLTDTDEAKLQALIAENQITNYKFIHLV